jgi:hypothetical protein
MSLLEWMPAGRCLWFRGRDCRATAECSRAGRLFIDAGLIARTGAPDDQDARQTFYRITHIGQREIEFDVRNITGSDP